MQIIPLYRYIRNDGGVTVSTDKPNAEYTELCRLVADDGYILTDGANHTPCVDTDDATVWGEIVDVENVTETEEKAAAYDVLMGVSE